MFQLSGFYCMQFPSSSHALTTITITTTVAATAAMMTITSTVRSNI